MSERFLRGALRVEPKEAIDGNDIWYGRADPKKPLVFRHTEGTRQTDLIGNSDLHPYLISQAFAELLTAAGFTGWKVYPSIIELKGSVVNTYAALSIVGRCGPVQVERSPLIPALKSDGTQIPGKFDHLGLYFDEDSWDGSDIFLPQRGPSRAIVSSSLRDAIVQTKLTNVDLERATEKRTPQGNLV